MYVKTRWKWVILIKSVILPRTTTSVPMIMAWPNLESKTDFEINYLDKNRDALGLLISLSKKYFTIGMT